MTGIPLESLITSSLQSLVLPEDRPGFIGFLNTISETKETTELTVRMKGRKTVFYTRLFGSRHTIGEVERACIVIADISALKSAEDSLRRAHDELELRVDERTRELGREKEALRISERRFRSFFENSLDGVMLTTVDGLVLAANKEMCRIVDMTEEEIIRAGQRGIAVHDKNLEAALKKRKQTGSFRGELCYRRKDGSHVPVEVSSGVFEDSDGRLLTSTIVRDITERRRAEEELRRSRVELELRVKERTRALSESNEKLIKEIERRNKAEREFAILSENSPIVIGRFDRELRYVYANSAAERISQIPNAQRVGETFGELGYRKEIAGRLESLLRACLETGQVQVLEGDMQFGESIVPVYATFVPELDGHGGVESVLMIAHDLTEQRRLEEQLRQAQKMEAVGTLAGGIAHDFNNMLAVVMGNAELALDDMGPDDESRRNIERIVKASKRARDLVKQILTFSRKTETGKNPIELKPIIKETFKLLRSTLPSTIRMDLKVQTEKDTVLADPSQIQQILMNLATNAAHAMRDDGGVLTVGISNVTFTDKTLPDSDMNEGDYVKLRVRDTGTGIDRRVLHRIFEPFFTTKEAGQGTGMGLAVVYGIVKSHGGGITVETRPGKGTTFNIFLPCTTGRTEEQEEGQDNVPRGKERVLLVDDEPLVLEITSQMIRKLGYDVITAETGAKAMKMFLDAPHRFDCVVTDQTMPEMTGVTLARKMLEKRPDIPIILFTGYSEVVSPEDAKAAGIRDYVMKPVIKSEIAGALRRALDAPER